MELIRDLLPIPDGAQQNASGDYCQEVQDRQVLELEHHRATLFDGLLPEQETTE